MKMMIVITILIMIAIKSIKITIKFGYHDIENSSCNAHVVSVIMSLITSQLNNFERKTKN